MMLIIYNYRIFESNKAMYGNLFTFKINKICLSPSPLDMSTKVTNLVDKTVCTTSNDFIQTLSKEIYKSEEGYTTAKGSNRWQTRLSIVSDTQQLNYELICYEKDKTIDWNGGTRFYAPSYEIADVAFFSVSLGDSLEFYLQKGYFK